MKNLIEGLKTYKDSLFLVAVIALVGLVGFGLGRLSARYQTAELKIQSTLVNTAELNKVVTGSAEKSIAGKSDSPSTESGEVTPENNQKVGERKIVGNKNSKIYHYDDCPGALKMKAENRVFFASVIDAQNAGYKPAGNCQGLE